MIDIFQKWLVLALPLVGKLAYDMKAIKAKLKFIDFMKNIMRKLQSKAITGPFSDLSFFVWYCNLREK